MANELELSPAAVERGAKKIPASSGPDPYRPRSWQARCALAENVLTAALRLDDPETVERVAGALWDHDSELSSVYGERLPTSNRDRERYRARARVAISALLAEPEEAEDG